MVAVDTYINIIVFGLLLVLLVYLVSVRRKLDNFKKAQKTMLEDINNFSKSTLEAKKAFEALENAHSKLSRSLENDKIESHKLKEDLLFLVEQGKMTADRLESSLHSLRPTTSDALVDGKSKANQDPSRPIDPPSSSKDKKNLKKLIENLR